MGKSWIIVVGGIIIMLVVFIYLFLPKPQQTRTIEIRAGDTLILDETEIILFNSTLLFPLASKNPVTDEYYVPTRNKWVWSILGGVKDKKTAIKFANILKQEKVEKIDIFYKGELISSVKVNGFDEPNYFWKINGEANTKEEAETQIQETFKRFNQIGVLIFDNKYNYTAYLESGEMIESSKENKTD